MDVLFLAFANSQKNPLPTLSLEEDGVYSMLVERQKQGQFLIHRDSYSNLAKINKYLGHFQDDLTLFLYSGHAGETTLLLGEEKANAKGIALQLKKSARKGKLKMVILNGCSTGGQVTQLLEVGVPVVIATNASVNDRSATEFSLRFFYCLLEKRMTIKDAFEEAIGPAQTATERDLKAEIISRDIFEENPPKKEIPLWGLFYNDKQVLNTNPIPESTPPDQKAVFEPNHYYKGHKYDHLKILENLGDKIYLINRRKQDKSLIANFREIGSKRMHLAGVLYGNSQEHPDRYIDRLSYYLNTWFDENVSKEEIANPLNINIKWPTQYTNWEELRDDVFFEFRHYINTYNKNHQNRNPIENIFYTNVNRHLIISSILNVGQVQKDSSLSTISSLRHCQQIIKDYFQFWESIPPRKGPNYLVTILVLTYTKEKKQIFGRLFSKKPFLPLVLKLLEECHQVSHKLHPEYLSLFQKFNIPIKEASKCFVFPKVESIEMNDIDVWLREDYIKKSLGTLNLRYKYYQLFDTLKRPRISMNQFREHLIEIIKTSS